MDVQGIDDRTACRPGRMLVDDHRVHSVVTHPRHQVTRARAGRSRQGVAVRRSWKCQPTLPILSTTGPVNANVEGSGATYAHRCRFSSLTTSPGRDTVLTSGPLETCPTQGYHCGNPLTVHLHYFHLVSHTQGCDTTTAWSRLSHHPRAVEARNLVISVDWSTACRLLSQWSSSAAGMGLDMK